MIQNVDLIVIGGGPGGYEVAAHEAAKGSSVVLIEKDAMGGTCLNRGCIPTKCLCAGAEAIENIRNVSEFGIDAVLTSASFAKAQERARNVVAQLRAGVEAAVGKCKVVCAEASVLPDGTVSAADEKFKAEKVIIATGSEPSALPIPGWNFVKTSDDFLKEDVLPAEIVIIGGGVIGIEFAYIANSYGTKVTVIEYCKEILPPFDAELAKRLRLKLTEKGVKFVTSAAVTEVKSAGDKLTVVYTDKKGEQSVEAEAVYGAVGRRAVVPAGLADAGIETDKRGFIVTDDSFETTRKGFYAVGDCNGRLMLAHVATAQAMSVVGNRINMKVVPAAVFTEPELAMVGKTTEQCKAEGLDYVAKKALYRANGKALASGHSAGLVKVLHNPDSGLIIGCHILGAHASDLIQEATLAMSQGLTIEQVGTQTIHGHPTLSEILASAM